MKKNLLFSFILTIVWIGCTSSQNNNVITVKGSDTMVILAQAWAEQYMSAHKAVQIQVTGGGSGTGISALINGSTDICNSSRAMKEEERAKLKEKYSSNGVEIIVAKDGVSMYLNDANPVSEFTVEQLRKIYSGEITNWKEVGGPDTKIVLYGRENNSGTYVFFKDHVLNGGDYASNMQSLSGTAAVVNAISKDKNGIGFGGAAYGKGIKFASVKKDVASKAVSPSAQTIKDGTYPLWRYLYCYTRQQPTGAMKEYLDWILSSEGQATVEKIGYFPVR